MNPHSVNSVTTGDNSNETSLAASFILANSGCFGNILKC